MTQSQDQERFARLLDEHRGILFKIASAYCSAPDRQDLVQTMAMEAWRAYRRYDPTRSFSTWLYRVALNVGISFFRAQRRHVSRLVPIDDHRLEGLAAAPEACHDDLAAALQSFIERLNEFDRALMLLYLDDEPYAAIADILGISQSNVATKINRIKQRLRRQAADALDV